VLSDGSVAYYAAGLGVIFDPTEGAADVNGYKVGTQRFFDKHTDDITCMAYAPGSNMIATSENGATPMVYIWDGLNMTVKHAIKCHAKRGGNMCVKTMANLAFSPSGTYLVMVSANDDHNIAVYNAESGQMVGAVKGGRDQIIELAW
jgi:WD40 repeat protein